MTYRVIGSRAATVATPTECPVCIERVAVLMVRQVLGEIDAGRSGASVEGTATALARNIGYIGGEAGLQHHARVCLRRRSWARR